MEMKTTSGVNYQVAAYFNAIFTQTIVFCYRTETSAIELAKLSAQVTAGLGVSFTATNAFIVTWPFYSVSGINSLISVQIILTTNGAASFIIYNYERLDVTGGGAWFANVGSAGNFSLPSISVNGSNVNASGQYIHQVYRKHLFYFHKILITNLNVFTRY
jgi:hypothetical protein